jgi:hypothetical protein
MIIGCSRVGVHKSYLVVAIGLTRIGVVPRLRDSRGRWISAHSVIDSISRVDDEHVLLAAPCRAAARLARVVVGIAVVVLVAPRRCGGRVIAAVLQALQYMWSYMITPPKTWRTYGYRS